MKTNKKNKQEPSGANAPTGRKPEPEPDLLPKQKAKPQPEADSPPVPKPSGLDAPTGRKLKKAEVKKIAASM